LEKSSGFSLFGGDLFCGKTCWRTDRFWEGGFRHSSALKGCSSRLLTWQLEDLSYLLRVFMETEVSAKISNAQVSLFRWGLQNPVETVGIFLVILLTVTVFSQVFSRYALQIPLAWSEELAMFLFQWLSFIGAAIAVRQSFHYGLDLLTKRLSPRPKTITQIFSSVLIFYISFLMIVKGYGMMQITRMLIYRVL